RVGVLPEPVELKAGESVIFAPEGQEGPGELPTTYQQLAEDVREGDLVLLADGLMELVVQEVMGDRVRMRIVHGGILTSNKGINLPDVKMSVPSLTEKDIRDLEYALEQDVDYIALSFVREVEDVLELQRRMPENGPLVVVKVEKGMALTTLREILEVSDAAMVARGAVGVEL